MKTVIVIQARLGSSRLPCKTLLNLHGQPVIDSPTIWSSPCRTPDATKCLTGTCGRRA